MIEAFRYLGSRMSLKLHFLHSHLVFFQENLDAMSDEKRKGFHLDIAVVETLIKRKTNASIMGDNYWFCRSIVK